MKRIREVVQEEQYQIMEISGRENRKMEGLSDEHFPKQKNSNFQTGKAYPPSDRHDG